ncbi:MAG: TonB-dependent receptor [Kangiellaceae bacterium]|nr:TonB-dependent receptor [Kangiellaceae bacterium]MCW8999413.1 TonB-dependent receptor [Kangiellaceae bacterium]MCW9018507.1 TonB-dependent receptor [Kangiellaceae bacterium]
MTDQLRAPDEPVFTGDYGQWHIDASYDLSDNLSVFVEGLNITDENIRMHGRLSLEVCPSRSLSGFFMHSFAV